MHALKFGSSDNEYIEIHLAPVPCDEPGLAWVETDVTIAVKGFRGSIKPMFEMPDFVCFGKELRSVYETLSGKATLNSREQQLFFTIEGNGLGAVSIEGYAYSHATYGNKLIFEFAIDQTFLPEPLSVLTHIAQEWSSHGA